MVTVNEHGAVFLAVDLGGDKRPANIAGFWTLVGLIAFVASRVERGDPKSVVNLTAEFEGLWDWARTARVGAVTSFYEVSLIVAVNPDDLGGNLDVSDYEAWARARGKEGGK